jgi:DNA-binding response OmpR family regulator
MSASILIVDGSDTIRTVLYENLEKEGYVVFEADEGKAAFKIVNQEKPDLIVSEVFLPDMDGVELCKRVKDISAVPDVPFVFLTSVQDMLIENRALRAGASDYLVKVNITRQEILLRVELLLHRNSFTAKIERYTDLILSGRLGVLSIWDIARFLHHHRMSGRLELFMREKRAAIYFNDGKIIDALLGREKSNKALSKMVDIDTGVYRFSHRFPARDITISENTSELIDQLHEIFRIKQKAEGR